MQARVETEAMSSEPETSIAKTSSFIKSNKGPKYPFQTDYNDHFETPLIAFQDVAPLLEWFRNKQRKRFRLYDPYYCNGRSGQLLRGLGFKTIHEKRDFYKDIEQSTVPKHDVLITNPPYSDKHKRQCLDYCFRQLREQNIPFLILMPRYVAARQYYRKHSLDDVVYLIPNERYQYDHPEGTGKEESPFESLWFCGVGKDNVESVKNFWNEGTSRPQMATSVEELEQLGAISTQNRPGVRQRKRKRRKADALDNVALGVTVQRFEEESLPEQAKKKRGKNRDGKTTSANATDAPTGNQSKQTDNRPSLHNVALGVAVQRIEHSPFKSPKKKSKYRDQSGKRTKKRF